MSSLEQVKILVVEDEKNLRDMIVMMLEHHGANVVQADNGVCAFDLFKQQGLDLIVTDIRMPKGDGLTLIKNIRQHTTDQRPPIVVITGFSDTVDQDIVSHGASMVLKKPFPFDVLVKTISDLL